MPYGFKGSSVSRYVYSIVGIYITLWLSIIIVMYVILGILILKCAGITFLPLNKEHFISEEPVNICFTCSGIGTEAQIITHDGTAIGGFVLIHQI